MGVGWGWVKKVVSHLVVFPQGFHCTKCVGGCVSKLHEEDITVTAYFIHPGGELKLSFNLIH